MNRKESQVIHLKQLSRQANSMQSLQSAQRPAGGWIKAVRQALGLSLQAVADKLKTSPQAIHQFEKSEATSSISLKHLESVAEAMGCRLVYAFIPRVGTLDDLASKDREHGRSAMRHSMALEGQAVESPKSPTGPSP